MKAHKIFACALIPCVLVVSVYSQNQQLDELLNQERAEQVGRESLFGSPIADPERTVPYGYRDDPITGEKRWHPGIDFMSKLGTPILAPADGEVLIATSEYQAGEQFGSVIVLVHNDTPYEDVIRTFFAHLNEIDVEVGQTITKGQRIGTVGQTGRVTSPQLHYEVWRSVNPWHFIMDERTK